MKNSIFELKKELKRIADSKKAKLLSGFFKTGKGEYGEGDIFLGIQVPQLRELVKTYKVLNLTDVEELLHSKFHEERLMSLFILVEKFNKGLEKDKKEIYNLYLKNTKWINNWDLIDLSAHEIVGRYLCRGPAASLPSASAPSTGSVRAVGSPSSGVTPLALIRLAKSKNLWERRIAVLSSFRFIKNNRFNEALDLAEMLVQDKHDLMHKAVGWMLREIGKRDLKTEIVFLDKYCQKMPRTMLRYAIEKFPEKLRLSYLRGK